VYNVARVLVWLMAPVAAEQLKYGKTVVSDPRRADRLLSVLDAVQAADSGGAKNRATNNEEDGDNATSGTSGAGPGKLYNIPESAADRKALVQWAYYEAVQLVRQYGELLEEVKGYLGTGTSTVGECAMMVEEELR
jgi:hypothetical protein